MSSGLRSRYRFIAAGLAETLVVWTVSRSRVGHEAGIRGFSFVARQLHGVSLTWFRQQHRTTPPPVMGPRPASYGATPGPTSDGAAAGEVATRPTAASWRWQWHSGRSVYTKSKIMRRAGLCGVSALG